jgi:hypothetical protein
LVKILTNAPSEPLSGNLLHLYIYPGYIQFPFNSGIRLSLVWAACLSLTASYKDLGRVPLTVTHSSFPSLLTVSLFRFTLPPSTCFLAWRGPFSS